MNSLGKNSTYLAAASLAVLIISMALTIITHPADSLESAAAGINLWWNILLPSLLPFLIINELILGLGIMHGLGVLLEPLMKPLFNVPGIGAMVISLGLASGYPMDAVMTCRLRRENLCTAAEAERLLAFTHTADPLFITGTVAVGMLGRCELGAVMAAAHYASSLLLGIVGRFYKRNAPATSRHSGRNIFLAAFSAFKAARQRDARGLGRLLGDACKTAMSTILSIGGFIVFFAVGIKMLSIVGLLDYLDLLFNHLLLICGFSSQLASALSIGTFEIDLGSLAAAQAAAPLNEKIAVISAIIAWSGLSVHGQVAGLAMEAGISLKPYILARFLHAALSAAISLLLLEPVQQVLMVSGDFAHTAAAAGLPSTLLLTSLAIISTLTIISILIYFVKIFLQNK